MSTTSAVAPLPSHWDQKNSSKYGAFFVIPHELISLMIFKDLDVKSIIRMSLTSSFFYTLSKETSIWENKRVYQLEVFLNETIQSKVVQVSSFFYYAKHNKPLKQAIAINRGGISCTAYNNNNIVIASNDPKKSLLLINTINKKNENLIGIDDHSRTTAISLQDSIIVTGEHDGSLHLWNTAEKKEIHSVKEFDRQISGVKLHENQAFSISKSSLKIFDITSFTKIDSIDIAEEYSTIVTEESFYITSTKNGNIYLRDYKSGKIISEKKFGSPVQSVSLWGNQFATLSSPNKIALWDTRNLYSECFASSPNFSSISCLYLYGETLIIAGTMDQSSYIYPFKLDQKGLQNNILANFCTQISGNTSELYASGHTIISIHCDKIQLWDISGDGDPLLQKAPMMYFNLES